MSWMRSMRALADKQILIILSALTLILAAGSLLLGLLAGYPILLRMGLAEFAAMLTEIPAGSAVVALVVTPLPFAVGVGLLWKGICESLVRSVVTGTVLASSYRLIPGDTQDEYVVYSSVRYVLDGVPRKSEGPHHGGLPSETEARQRLAALRPGDPVQVFYRKGEPGVVFLDGPPESTRTVLAVGAWITFTGLVATFLTGVVLAG
jgi:hypothetical protein